MAPIDDESFSAIISRTRREKGLILIADDQAIVLESLRSSIRNIGALDLTEFYSNG